MNKKLSLLVMLLVFCTSMVQAQTKETKRKSFFSFDIGVNTGSMTEKLTKEITTTYSDGRKETNKIGYDLDFSTLSYTAALEFQLDGFITMFEARYTTASYKKYNDYTDEGWFKLNPTIFSNTNLYEGAFYFGATINRKHRFQLPIMGGFGVNYIDGAPIKDLGFEFLYKIRAKYYLSDKIGIYLGLSGSYGGLKKDDDDPGPEAVEWKKKNSNSEDLIDVAIKRLYFEAGLTILLGRKK